MKPKTITTEEEQAILLETHFEHLIKLQRANDRLIRGLKQVRLLNAKAFFAKHINKSVSSEIGAVIAHALEQKHPARIAKNSTNFTTKDQKG